MPQTYRNDALHEVAMESIHKLQAVHKTGRGGASLTRLAHLFGFPLSESELANLDDRGEITFRRSTDKGGSFYNIAAPVTINSNGMKISVPGEIAGTYSISDRGFSMSFEDDKTISGSFLMLKSKLQAVTVDPEQILVDLGGDSFDQCILHG